MRTKSIGVVVAALAGLASYALTPVTAGAATSRGAVTIASNGDFGTCGCVTSGNGSPSKPFVIGPYQIGIPSSGSSGWAVKIDNSHNTITDSFAISGISIGYNDAISTDPVIWLLNVHGTQANPISISNIDANNDGTGIEIDTSSYVSLNDLNINKGNGGGIVINGSDHISLANSKLKATADGQSPHTSDGLYALNSSNLQIGGVAACPKSGVCNSFDYDSGFGVYFQNVSSSFVNAASANADDTGGFILDGSNYDVIANSTSQAGGPICITVGGQRISSGYVSDLQGGIMLINGSGHDTLQSDALAADPGMELGDGGNGFFANPCTNTNDPFPTSQIEATMGTGNTFPGTCFNTTDVPGLAPNPCK